MESTNKGEGMKKVIVGLAIGALALAGCSSSDNQSATQVSSSAQAQASKAAAAHAAAIAQASQQAQARAAVKAKATAKAKVAHARAVAHAKAVAHTQAVKAAQVRAHAKAVKAAKVGARRRAVAKAKPDLCAHSYMGRNACHRAFPDGLVPEVAQAPTNPDITGCNPYYMYCEGTPPPRNCSKGKKWDVAHQSCLPISLLERARTNDITPAEGDLIDKCNNGTYSLSSKRCATVPRPGND